MTYLDSQRTTPPPRLAVDAKGYVWRVYDDGHWSMAPSNPDNSPVPEPITYYVRCICADKLPIGETVTPCPLDWHNDEGADRMTHKITTTRTVTVEYDDEGRVIREVTVTVEEHNETQAAEVRTA
jgi:YD repeat-containing protein